MKQAAGTFIFSLTTKKFLWNQRSLSISSPATWALWGGWNENNESLVQTVIRETLEETGFLIYPEDIHFLQKEIINDGNQEYHTFISFVDNEFLPVLSEESMDYQWTTFEERPYCIHYGIESIFRNKGSFNYLNNL